MTRRLTRRWVRPLAAAGVAGVAALAFASLASAQTTSPTTTTTTAPGGSTGATAGVTLNGEGSAGPYKEVVTWQNDLATAQTPINLNYTVSGSQDGRQDFLNNQADFVISGTNFCEANEGSNCPTGGFEGFLNSELSGAGLSTNQPGHESKDLIDAPVSVTALALVDAVPIGGFVRQDYLCDPNDPSLPDFSVCILNSPFISALRIPANNIGAMMLNDPGPGVSDLNSWDNPSVLTALGITPVQCDGGNGNWPDDGLTFPTPGYHCLSFAQGLNATPTPIWQSDADESNFFLQQYIKTAAPSVWTGNEAASPDVNWQSGPNSTVTERMPRQPGASRQAVDDIAGQLLLGGYNTPVESGGASAIGALPPSAEVAALQTAPAGYTLENIWIQNDHGDWTEPTPQSIDAAIDAGGDTPLYALTHNVQTAYPLTWAEHLYVRAKGLTAAKTEAMATLIRYLVTAGQNAAAQWGEGTLSPPLVTQALNAANQVVQSNCPSAGGTIVQNSSPGSDAPSLPGLSTIGTMLHCQAPPAAPPASVSAGSTQIPTFNIPLLPTVSPTVAAQGPVAATKPKTVLPAALTTTKLPIPLPGTTLDRVATLVLGAGLYLLLRNPLRRLLGPTAE